MAIANLTQKTLEAAKPGEHVIRLRDGNVKGFHLVIHPNGTRVSTAIFRKSAPIIFQTSLSLVLSCGCVDVRQVNISLFS